MIPLLIALAVGAFGTLYVMGDKTNKICRHRELNELMGDGIICSKHVRLSVHQSNEHVGMCAPSGAGKSRKVLAYNLDLPNCSEIVTDPSGELARLYKGNKKVYILNPFSEDGIGYDPLFNCKSEFDVAKIAETMLENGGVENNEKQKEWIDMSTNLITGFMLMNFAKKRYTFNQMMQLICTAPIYVPIPKEEEIEEKKAKNEEIDIPYSLYYDVMVSGVKSAQEEMESFMAGYQAQSTVGSIRMVLNTVAKLFRKEVVTRLIDKPSIDFKKFREEESILFIQIPERHADFFKPIVATLITQLIDVLLDNDGLQVYMLLDEFSNIGKIPSFAKLLSTARKHRLSIFVFVQSLMQLERTYGNDGKEIRELFKTLLLTGGLKDSTEYFSKLIGKDNEDKPLMSEEELRMMDEDEMIIICNNKRPVKDYMLDIMRG